jgi:hypothetical protein
MTETVIECPVCLEPTTNRLDNTCNHPLCLDCMGHMTSNSRLLAPSGFTIVECPLCRMKSKPAYWELEARCGLLTAQFLSTPLQVTHYNGPTPTDSYYTQQVDTLAQAVVQDDRVMTEAEQRTIPQAEITRDHHLDTEFQLQARRYLAGQAVIRPASRQYPLRQRCKGQLPADGVCNKMTQRTCRGSGCYNFGIHTKVCRDCQECSFECKYHFSGFGINQRYR